MWWKQVSAVRSVHALNAKMGVFVVRPVPLSTTDSRRERPSCGTCDAEGELAVRRPAWSGIPAASRRNKFLDTYTYADGIAISMASGIFDYLSSYLENMCLGEYWI